MSHKSAKRARRVYAIKAKAMHFIDGDTRPERRRSLRAAIWILTHKAVKR